MIYRTEANALDVAFQFVCRRAPWGDQPIAEDFPEWILGVFRQAATDETPGNIRRSRQMAARAVAQILNALATLRRYFCQRLGDARHT